MKHLNLSRFSENHTGRAVSGEIPPFIQILRKSCCPVSFWWNTSLYTDFEKIAFAGEFLVKHSHLSRFWENRFSRWVSGETLQFIQILRKSCWPVNFWWNTSICPDFEKIVPAVVFLVKYLKLCRFWENSLGRWVSVAILQFVQSLRKSHRQWSFWWNTTIYPDFEKIDLAGEFLVRYFNLSRFGQNRVGRWVSGETLSIYTDFEKIAPPVEFLVKYFQLFRFWENLTTGGVSG